jgi:hypothetical protein
LKEEVTTELVEQLIVLMWIAFGWYGNGFMKAYFKIYNNNVKYNTAFQSLIILAQEYNHAF